MGNSLWGATSTKPCGAGSGEAKRDLAPNTLHDIKSCTKSRYPLEVAILGTGAGATFVYSRQCSSSFVVIKDGEPVLLCDVGYGVTASCLQHVGQVPPHIYVSHNHGDHCGELPVVLSVESTAAAAAGRAPPALYSHPDVMAEIREYRLRELRSTGRPLEDFASFHEVPAGCMTSIGDTGLAVQPFRSQHSETCYGLLLYDEGRPFLGWTADSGFDDGLCRELSAAPRLLVDARRKGSVEHAGFKDLPRLAELPFLRNKLLYVTGYGRQDEAPSREELPGSMLIAWPSMRMPATVDAKSDAPLPVLKA